MVVVLIYLLCVCSRSAAAGEAQRTAASQRGSRPARGARSARRCTGLGSWWRRRCGKLRGASRRVGGGVPAVRWLWSAGIVATIQPRIGAAGLPWLSITDRCSASTGFEGINATGCSNRCSWLSRGPAWTPVQIPNPSPDARLLTCSAGAGPGGGERAAAATGAAGSVPAPAGSTGAHAQTASQLRSGKSALHERLPATTDPAAAIGRPSSCGLLTYSSVSACPVAYKG